MKRYFIFLGVFAVCVTIGYMIHMVVGSAVAGLGFGIAYHYGGVGNGSNKV